MSENENLLTTTHKRRKKLLEDALDTVISLRHPNDFDGDTLTSWKELFSTPETALTILHSGKELFSTSETAWILNSGKSTLEQKRLSGGLGLKYVRLGNRVFYRRQDIEEFINNLPAFEHTTAEQQFKSLEG